MDVSWTSSGSPISTDAGVLIGNAHACLKTPVMGKPRTNWIAQAPTPYPYRRINVARGETSMRPVAPHISIGAFRYQSPENGDVSFERSFTRPIWARRKRIIYPSSPDDIRAIDSRKSRRVWLCRSRGVHLMTCSICDVYESGGGGITVQMARRCFHLSILSHCA